MNWKKENGVSPSSSMAPETRRLVPDPISVVMPPSTAANDSGIMTLEGDTANRPATASMIGMQITTTGMLFRKPETSSTTSSVTMMVGHLRPPPRDITSCAPRSRTPARTIPCPTTSSASTVIRAELEKPWITRSASSTLAPSAPTMGKN